MNIKIYIYLQIGQPQGYAYLSEDFKCPAPETFDRELIPLFWKIKSTEELTGGITKSIPIQCLFKNKSNFWVHPRLDLVNYLI